MKKINLFILLSFFCFNLNSQIRFPGEQYAPVSPQVAALGNYGNIPVNKYVGRPSVSIPIYQINTGELSLPISLTYNYSGLKITENPTRVGLGWFLDAGGMITQIVKGVTDDKTYGYSNNEVPLRLEDHIIGSSLEARVNYWRDVYSGITTGIGFSEPCRIFYDLRGGGFEYDSEPDVYQYNFNGQSGKFVFDKNNDIHLVPQKPLEINRTRTPHPNIQDFWTIIDEIGTQYIFSKKEIGGSTSSSDGGSTQSFNLNSYSWLIDRIISPSGKDSITFEYDYFNNETYPLAISQSRQFGQHFGGGDYLRVNTLQINTGSTHLLKRITFKNGSIEFIPGEIRQDALNGWKKTLGNIIIKDNNQKTIKSFDFKYGYWENKSAVSNEQFYDKRLYLKQVQQKNANETLPPYKFTYIDTDRLGRRLNFPSRQPEVSNGRDFSFYSQDHLGYYNGQSNRTLLSFPVSHYSGGYRITNFTSANRDPNPDFAKLGMLIKIEYPTGGYTEFEYEPHQNANVITGGLRIESMRDCSDPTNCNTQRYKYFEGRLTSDKKSNIIESENNYTFSGVGGIGTGCDEVTNIKRLIVSSPTHHPIGGSAIGYSKVETYFESDNGDDNGKIVEFFTNELSFLEETYDETPFSSQYDLSWRRGVLKKIENHKSVGTSTRLVQSMENEYNFFNDFDGLFSTLYYEVEPINPNIYGLNLTVVNGLQIIPVKEWFFQNSLGKSGFIDISYSSGGNFEAYLDNPYHVISEWNYKTKSIEKFYDQDDPTKYLETITNYFYDNKKHLQLTRSETIDSKGNLISTKTSYPDDVNDLLGLSTAERNAIIKLNKTNLHRIAIPIHTETTNNGQKTTQRTLYNNQKWPNLVVPEFIQTSKGSNNLEDKITYDKFDTATGKPLEISRVDGTHVVYVWGYQNSQLIAKIENASYASLTSSQLTLITNAKNASNLDTNISTENTLRTKLEQLRGGFPNAMVSTYAYDPLIGVKSITDPRGQTIYYHYDNFNRLEYVTDSNGKVLSKNEYNYKN